MQKIVNFRPIMFIAVSLCLGIATAYCMISGIIGWAILFISVFLGALAVFFFVFTNNENKNKNAIYILAFILVFLFGGLWLGLEINNFQTANLNGSYYSVCGRVKSVYETQSGCKIILDEVNVKGVKSGQLNYNMSVTVYGKNDIKLGDVIVFSQHIYDNNYLYEGKFNVSDVERKIRYNTSVSIDELTKIGNKTTIFENINSFIKNSLASGLDENEFSVAYAMLTGDDAYMDYDLISAYRTAGVAHVFAVSGLHIGFLATALAFIFDKLRLRGYYKAIIISVLLFLYSGVCGFSASSIRASVMTTVLLLSRAKGDRYDFLSSVSLACIILLVLNPINLMCVGFQLSFAVVIGINLFAKPISKLFKFLPDKVASALGVVLSAQLVSIPVCLASFGQFSWISVCANLVFVPFVSILFTLTFFACIMGGLFSISNITLFISNYVFKFVNICIPALDSNFFMVSGIVLGASVIAFYVALILPSGIIRIKKPLKSILTIAMSIVFIFGASLYTIDNNNAIKLYVSGAESLCATFISSPQESTLVVSNTSYIYSVTRLNRIKNDSGKSVINNLVFTGGYSLDMQVFITKLRTVFGVEKVFYYGEKDERMENLLTKSFFITNINNCKDGDKLNFSTSSFTYELDGRVLKGEINGKKVAIMSAFGKQEPAFSTLDCYGLDYFICCERAEVLLSKYKPQNPVAYLHSTVYQNAQTNGNLCYRL